MANTQTQIAQIPTQDEIDQLIRDARQLRAQTFAAGIDALTARIGRLFGGHHGGLAAR
ncbi:hypothetical protein P7L78_08570 [Tistrella bauzanensis]|jgi:hypothetical protein|uniref:DUF3618 domain-containing protein n=1 Tax=Tistrella arctica TaxID=3133430 RepID=A0ABU9YMV7_9PROT